MKRVAVILITFILCATLFGLTACGGSGAYNGDGERDINLGPPPTSDPSGSATASSDSSDALDYDKFLKFELMEDGNSYKVVENYVGYNYYGTTMVIPATHDGKPVTAIAPYAFSEYKKLESITFSENITDITASAFYFCQSLKEIKIVDGNAKYRCEGNCLIEKTGNKIVLGCSTSIIPSSVTAIGEHAFYQCAGLKVIDIPASVTEISEKAYYKCTALEEIKVNAGNTVYTSESSSGNPCNCLIEKNTKKVLLTCKSSNIPENISGYGKYAFNSNPEVVSLVVPDGTEEISGDMFEGFTNLVSITIPASVTRISGFAFRDCPNLKQIVINGTSSPFKVDNGCVIEKDTNILVLGAVEAVIPNGITKIDDYAFYYRIGLKSINIPASVKEIGCSAFYRCNNGNLLAEFAVEDGWYAISYFDINNEPHKVPVNWFTYGEAAVNLTEYEHPFYCD